jgi:hypothetical protein
MDLSKTRFYPTFFATVTLAMAFSACKTAGREPGSLRATSVPEGNPGASSSELVESDFLIPKSKFPEKITQTLVTRRKGEELRIQGLLQGACSKTETLANRLVTKLIASNKLELVVDQTPSMILIVDCSNKTLKLPETKAGVLWIYPELLKGFSTEDQVAALLAHELVHYTRSHEEDIEERLSSWMPFREDAVNRSRWEHEKEADRLTPRLLDNAGLDPFAATEIPTIVDKLLTGTPGWNGGKINFPIDSADERQFKIKFEIKQLKLVQSTQTVGQMPAVKEELAARP